MTLNFKLLLGLSYLRNFNLPIVYDSKSKTWLSKVLMSVWFYMFCFISILYAPLFLVISSIMLSFFLLKSHLSRRSSIIIPSLKSSLALGTHIEHVVYHLFRHLHVILLDVTTSWMSLLSSRWLQLLGGRNHVTLSTQ